MLLQIRNLAVTTAERSFLVADASFDVGAEQIVGLVGASGSGKTTTGLAVLQLLADGLRIASGDIRFDGRPLTTYTEAAMRKVRGRAIGMIFQDPLQALNPVFTVGFQIEEVLRYHTDMDRSRRAQRILTLLDMVGIGDPRRTAGSYPHQLSGGMRQRAMIAQAIAAEPQLLIADEPTSSLDVTLQARIMDLFRRLQRELRLSVLLITHDLGVVQHLAERVVVMEAGRVVEQGTTATVLRTPEHPYTRQLMQASGSA